jgi:hypothetical protein
MGSLTLLLPVTAALATLFAPGGERRILFNRLVFAVAALVFTAVIAPLDWLAVTMSMRRLDAGDPQAHSEALRTALGGGRRDFRGIDVSGTDLSGLDLSYVSFDGADLRGTDFREAILVEASLLGARMEGAHLEGTDLVGALVEDDGFDGAVCDRTTNLSEGFICEAERVILVGGP